MARMATTPAARPWAIAPMGSGGLLICAVLALVAIALPTLLVYNTPPSTSFYNHTLAVFGWGGLCAWLAYSQPHAPPVAGRQQGGLLALLASIGLLILAALATPLWTHRPASLVLGPASVLAAGAVVLVTGWRVGGCGVRGEVAIRVFFGALVFAAFVNVVIAFLQVLAPSWSDGFWLAVTNLPGRGVGNIRHPNLLSTLLLWACAAVVWFVEAAPPTPGHERRARWAAVALIVFIAGVAVSGSRTGMVSVLLLTAWGLLDRTLARALRWSLIAAPLIYLVCWGGMHVLAAESSLAFGRNDGRSDLSSSRFGVWANALTLIRMHPLSGVGFGELNFAWSLTPFAERPHALFDHAHNIVLHFLVELGVPMGLLVLALMTWSLWKLVVRARGTGGTRPNTARAALFMVLVVALHSQLEYPLWYAYFLLPTLFAWGAGLSGAEAAGAPAAEGKAREGTRSLRLMLASVALLVGALLATWDYQRAAAIYATSETPLATRIEAGKRSPLFAYQADYAAVLAAAQAGDAIDALKGASHHVLDGRMLRTWAMAEAALGRTERARYLVHRLREFRLPEDKELFEMCSEPAAAERMPFPCGPDAPLRFEDFR